ncbi:MAG: hypothetical protein Ta2E_12610 [Mycoplasmoidaceae bacterium]|nr:MAG: hypothetical protein Ta2E_12610 [Mycoplasmoidaceae bacterium]
MSDNIAKLKLDLESLQNEGDENEEKEIIKKYQ